MKLKDCGEERPKYYLPVRGCTFTQHTECYFFLIAPFVLIWNIIVNTFRIVWMDTFEYNDRLSRLVEEEKKKRVRIWK